MQKADLIQTCTHIFNTSPLRKILKEIYRNKEDQKKLSDASLEDLAIFMNENMKLEEIKSLIFSNFYSYTQEIHVFHITNKGKLKLDKTSIAKMLNGLQLFGDQENISDLEVHHEVGRIYMLHKAKFEGYLIKEGTTSPTGNKREFPYFLPILIEFLPPYYVKVRMCKLAIRTGTRFHFSGQAQLLLNTELSIYKVVGKLVSGLSISSLKMDLESTNLFKSVVDTANKKEISATVIKWDEKDGVHYTHRGRNNRTLHPFSYIQKVLQQEALGVGDGVWYFTDPKRSLVSQQLKDLSAIRVIPAQGFIAYDSYRKEEIEDKVNEFITLAN